ncbi:helix-turn-helix domain-containing protein [Natranaerofaba carboxydovora]|uniref:helix-turn-helix domain-containing protein n=1 Tax=Natranaerofaba carboxydovora TaxID=2742683 RepID=UPI001F134373|nr:helix-turn-helix domain-containing protein [Natranaerofaba carboxydovora]UMZ73470.1 Helix-turn-helix domain protein [Natranaerofaba carboxydovora]
MSDENVDRLGSKLKQARENMGYSIEDIQKITKLRAKYIKAIESNDFSVFSGDVYAKGSIRNYADIVGLDHEELWEEYELYFKMDEDEQEEPESTADKDKKERPGQPQKPQKEKKEKSIPIEQISDNPIISSGIKKGLVAVILLVVIVGGIWSGYNFIMSIDLNGDDNDYIVENDKDKEELEDKEDKETENDENDIDEKDEEKEFVQDEEQEINFESVEEYNDWDYFNYTISNVDNIEIEGNIVEGECWLGNFIIDDGSEPEMSGMYGEGDSFSITAEEEFVVLIGNPTAIELIINEENYDFISDLEEHDYSTTSPFYFNIALEEQ